MAIIWQNTFDGPSGNTTTVTNSGNYGEALAAVSGTVTYQQAQRAAGVSALNLGSATGPGTITVPYSPASTSNWSMRFYVRIDAGRFFTVRAIYPSGGSDLVSISDQSGSQFAFIMGQLVPTATVSAMRGTWARVELGRNAGVGFARVWWTSIHSAGAPDWQTASGVSISGITSLVFGGGSSATGIVRLDQLAVGQGEQIGPYTPGTDTLATNRLDGPDGGNVTVANTANWGTAAASAVGPPTYSTEWSAWGSSARLTGTSSTTRTMSWALRPNRAQYSARWYFRVPPGGRHLMFASGTQMLMVSPQDNGFGWIGGTLNAVATQLLDRTVRAELLRVDYTTTLRLWWIDPHSTGAPDFQQSVTSSDHPIASNLRFEGAGGGNPGSFVDAVEIRQGGWIGPPLVHTGAAIGAIRIRAVADGRRGGEHPAEGRIVIRGEADGRMLLPTAAEGRIVIRGEADGIAGPSTASGGVVDSMWIGPLGLLHEVAERGQWERTPALGVERHVALSGRVTSSRARWAPRTTSLAWDRLLPADADALEEMALVPARGDGTLAVIDPDAAGGNLLTAEQSRGRPQAGMMPGAVEDLYGLAGAGAITVGLSAGVRHACTNNVQANADIRWLHPYYGTRGWPVMPGWSVYLSGQTTGAAVPASARMWLTFRDHNGAVLSSAAGDPGTGVVEADAPAGAVTVAPHMITTTALSGLRIIGEARLTYAPQDADRPLGNGCPVYTLTDYRDTPALPYRSVALTLEEVRAHAPR